MQSDARPAPKVAEYLVALLPVSSLFSWVYIIFETPTQSSWSQLPPTHCEWACSMSSIQPTQLTRHYHRGSIHVMFTLENRCTSFMLPAPLTQYIRWGIVLFTLGNRHSSGYTTDATHAACQGIFPVYIQHIYVY